MKRILYIVGKTRRHRLLQVSREGHGALPVIGCSRDRWGCWSSSPWFIDLGVQLIEGILIRDSCRLITMTPVPYKQRWALGRRGAGKSVRSGAVRRRLRQRLGRRTHISIPEGLYPGVVWVCVVILNVLIGRPAATRLVSVLQLRVRRLNPEGQTESQLR